MVASLKLNNMIRTLCFSIFLSIFLSTSSQQLSIDFSAGYSAFAMNDLNEFNTFILEDMPFKAKLTDSFPNNFEYKITPLLKLEKMFSIGLRWSTTSTGSKIHVKDYSGEYSLKASTSINTIGLVVSFGPFQLKNFSFYINNNLGKNYSKLKYTEYFSLYEVSHDTTYNFKSNSNYCEPTIQMFYNFGIFELGLNCGYFIDFKGTYSSTLYDTNSLELHGKKIKSDWSGMRYGIIVKVKPFYNKKRE
jgi:hypothetical protein